MRSYISRASIVDWARLWAEHDCPKFHAALMDAPYHLTSITNRFGADDAAPAQYGKDGAFQRASRGFMGTRWDGGDVAFRVDTWRAVYDVLYPGAFMFVFGGSRTFHRMAVAIEDAGFVQHPTAFLFGWAFGSGFPKSTRIDTQIDRDAGAEREVVGKHPAPNGQQGGLTMGDGWQPSPDITAPGTPLAQQWQGHRYGLQALKPSLEPILCVQKPYDERPVDSITASGSGALNIDAGRIGVEGGGWGVHPSRGYSGGLDSGGEAYSAGRWPANVALSHSPDCTPSQCAPGCGVAALGEQSGVLTSGKMTGEYEGFGTQGIYGPSSSTAYHDTYADTGTAARFFHNSDYYLEVAEQIAASDPMLYAAKADRWQREAGLIGQQPTTVNDGRQTPIDNAYQRGETQRRNSHPTVKPLTLTHWLASLLLPPDEYAPRRLLIPFSGSGSEMIGAMLAGWDHVQGVEIEREYIDIARQRIAFWQDYAGMDYDTARKYAEAKQEELERAARMDAPIDDLPLLALIAASADDAA